MWQGTHPGKAVDVGAASHHQCAQGTRQLHGAPSLLLLPSSGLLFRKGDLLLLCSHPWPATTPRGTRGPEGPTALLTTAPDHVPASLPPRLALPPQPHQLPRPLSSPVQAGFTMLCPPWTPPPEASAAPPPQTGPSWPPVTLKA